MIWALKTLKTAGFSSTVPSELLEATYILNKPIHGSICDGEKTYSCTGLLQISCGVKNLIALHCMAFTQKCFLEEWKSFSVKRYDDKMYNVAFLFCPTNEKLHSHVGSPPDSLPSLNSLLHFMQTREDFLHCSIDSGSIWAKEQQRDCFCYHKYCYVNN